MSRNAKKSRRATVLVMIVGLLATLFLIVTAYITLARFDKFTAASARKSRTIDDVLANVNTVVLSALRQSLADANGNVLAGGRSDPTKANSAVVAGYSPENIAGYGGSRWLAGAEAAEDKAIRDPNNPDHPNVLIRYPPDWRKSLRTCKQTVSSFGGSGMDLARVPFQTNRPWDRATVQGLMLWNDKDVQLNDPTPAMNDLWRNVRRPFGDASGSGVPDSSFVGTASLTELANAVADVAVRAPTYVWDSTNNKPYYFNPSALGDPDPNSTLGTVEQRMLARQWQQFDDRARYEVAVKVVDNGGMVALTSPGYSMYAGAVPNREFVTGMFNWMRYQGNSPGPDPRLNDGGKAEERLNKLAAEAAQVEPLLRVRGGLLADNSEKSLDAVPLALRELSNYGKPGAPFQRTFDVVYDTNLKTDAAQRFNLAYLDQNQKNEWMAWRASAALDPDWASVHWTAAGISGIDARNPRHLLTVLSNSDELARKVGKEPNPNTTELGLYTGQLKFYLGDIARAFDDKGCFVSVDPTTNIPRGRKVIQRLANYYYEMLSDYDGQDAWQDDTYVLDSPVTTKWEAVSRRHQAIMLAVNTVAFAAPRNQTTGFVDTVYYVDSNKVYVGHAPQPFITQVVACCEGGGNAGSPAHKGLGIELYDPDDPDPAVTDPTAAFDNSQDGFALDMSQFALSLNSNNPNVAGNFWIALNRLTFQAPLSGTRQRMTGRNFFTVAINDPPTAIKNHCLAVPPDAASDLPVGTVSRTWTKPDGTAVTARVIDVKLWRRGRDGGKWYLIDKLTVGDDDDEANRIPDADSTGKDLEWVVDYYRDTGDVALGDKLLGGEWTAGVVTPARWRSVTDVHIGVMEKRDPEADPPEPQIALGNIGSKLGKPGAYQGSVNFAPIVPLYTMNAGGKPATDVVKWREKLPKEQWLWRWFFMAKATDPPVHGAYRPLSFPTPGFLLFVPRFANVTELDANFNPINYVPMSELLRNQWRRTQRNHWENGKDTHYKADQGVYPADFGHMWVFDNHQPVRKGSYLAVDSTKEDAQVPWGMLIFDYFTTLDPNADYDRDGNADVDPLRVAGRVNINTAPWQVLAGLPVLNPVPDIANFPGGIDKTASPAFWSMKSGVLVGQARNTPLPPPTTSLPRFDPTLLTADSLAGGNGFGWYRLGPLLAQAAASYRDRIRYCLGSDATGGAPNPLFGADDRNATTNIMFRYRNISGEAMFGGSGSGGYGYGAIRRETGTNDVKKAGFLSLGELLNVNGFDGPVVNPQSPAFFSDPRQILYRPLGRWNQSAVEPQHPDPDFFKAVSLMALLDTQFLTTRSNTFTVYVSVMDRQNPQASIRSQLTVDRSNLLPKLVLDVYGEPLWQAAPLPAAKAPITVRTNGLPEIVTQRQIGYFNTQFDQ